MISVNLDDVWNINEENVIVAINEVINEIDTYIIYRKKSDFDSNRFIEMYDDFCSIIKYWVGYTYVGDNKSQELKKTFNIFFISFMNLLLFLKQNPTNSSIEKKLHLNALYKGKIYRYLGNNNPTIKTNIIVNYDGVYSSWTKNSRVPYIESKLYGEYIILSAIADEKQYGIDIHILGIGRQFEGEVIFPTIKDRIINIQKIKEDDSNE